MAVQMITEVHGAGEPVLLVHGLGGTSNVFSAQVGVLSRYFECIRPDLPGSGRTPATAPFTLPDLADQLADLLRGRGVQSAHMIGHSLGTVVCQYLAVQHPSLVRSLSLIGPLAAPPEPARAALKDRAAKARAEGMAGIADAIVQGGTSADTKAHRPEVAALVREILMRQDAEGYALTCEALSDVQSADPNQIKCPTLLITGDEDGTAPPMRVKALTASIAGAHMEILDRCGHWTTFERAAEVNRLLLNFLVSL